MAGTLMQYVKGIVICFSAGVYRNPRSSLVLILVFWTLTFVRNILTELGPTQVIRTFVCVEGT